MWSDWHLFLPIPPGDFASSVCSSGGVGSGINHPTNRALRTHTVSSKPWLALSVPIPPGSASGLLRGLRLGKEPSSLSRTVLIPLPVQLALESPTLQIRLNQLFMVTPPPSGRGIRNDHSALSWWGPALANLLNSRNRGHSCQPRSGNC